MLRLVLGALFILIGLSAWGVSYRQQVLKTVYRLLAVLCFFVAAVFFLSTSFLIVDADQVGHLTRIYLGDSMKPGQVIALEGQKGPQARVLPPGFHFRLFLNILYKVEKFSMEEIPEGSCGKLTAADGQPLRAGQIFADEWAEADFSNMLDAEHFLTHGGQKGPQLSVLRPGKYRLNRYLFKITRTPVTSIQAGYVGVVKSNVQQAKTPLPPDQAVKEVSSGLKLIAQVVPRGYVGVWQEVLPPGQYYLNNDAFEVIPFDTRVQTWEYIGGFHRRWIDLEISQDGKITQRMREQDIPIPKTAADMAIIAKVEGWEVPVDLRVLLQVTSEKAPYVVASVGNIEEIENDVLTPTIRSVVRNVLGDERRKVFDLMNRRTELEDLVEKEIIPEGEKAWISIKEIRIGEPVIPPELLVARLRQQLAQQLKATFEEEQKAQQIRVETEKKRAEADQQPTLIAAQIERDAAEFKKQAEKLRGEGEKLRLIEVAEGQKSQVSVLGEDKVLQLAMLKEILEAAKANPDIVKVPAVLVQGEGSSLEGAAAVLGASNLMNTLRPAQTSAKPAQPK